MRPSRVRRPPRRPPLQQTCCALILLVIAACASWPAACGVPESRAGVSAGSARAVHGRWVARHRRPSHGRGGQAAEDRDVARDAEVARTVGNEQDIACGDVERRAVILRREGAPALDDDGDGESPDRRRRNRHRPRAGRPAPGRTPPPRTGGPDRRPEPRSNDAAGRRSQRAGGRRGSTLSRAVARGSPRKACACSRPKRSCSSMTEKSVGSCSSTSRTPAPIAWGCPAGHEDRVATGDLDRVERREESLVLGVDEGRELVGLQAVPEADPDGGTRLGVEDEPGLGLAVVAVEVPGGEGAVGVASGPGAAHRCRAAWSAAAARRRTVRRALRRASPSRRPRAQPAASCRRRAR